MKFFAQILDRISQKINDWLFPSLPEVESYWEWEKRNCTQVDSNAFNEFHQNLKAQLRHESNKN